MRLVLLFGAPSLGQWGCSDNAPARPGALGERRAELAGATVDSTNSGVLALLAVTPEKIELCTATLLTPNLLLTARHCIAPTSADVLLCDGDPVTFREPYSPSILWVNRSDRLSGSLQSFGLLPLTGGSDEFLRVAAVRVPESREVCGGDIAAVILERDFAEDEARPIAPRLDEPVVTSEPYGAVGFGSTPDVTEQGVRRSRDDLTTSCAGDDCLGRGNVGTNEFAGGEGVCSGDSGGPAIDRAGRVIGVASRSLDCRDAVYSAVSGWRTFIRDAAEEAQALGDYPAPSWLVEAPPEPEPEPEPEPVESLDDPSADLSLDADAGGSPATAEDAASHDDSQAASPPVITIRDGDSGCALRAVPTPRASPAPGFALTVAMLAMLAKRGRYNERRSRR